MQESGRKWWWMSKLRKFGMKLIAQGYAECERIDCTED